ncbi:MAG: HD domain-containing protein [Lachnospiraceae bacterium]|nr:HD domain-containing protein [Lachnospiraceae bacterium]
MIKAYPVTGYNILSEIKSRPDLAIGARWHHERYDGRGYPDKKAGEKIPLEARIIAVADCYDAMTSNRSYRSYLPQD